MSTALAARPPRTHSELPESRVTVDGMSGHHLLVVDDEDNLRSMLAAALQHHGFAVSEAANGREALDQIPARRPDLILLDVMMPDLDGFEVCRRLRAEGDRTPVLFLTARDSTEDKVRGLFKRDKDDG